MTSRLPAWGLLLALVPLAPAARAQNQVGLVGEPALTVTYRSVYHAYQVRLYSDRAADGTRIDLFRNVNPLYQTLDVGGWSLGPSADIDVVTSLRYRTDFGTGFHLDTPEGNGIPAVDGRDQFQVQTMYVDWRNVVPSTLDLRLGRQILLDDLDWYSLDGLKASVHLARSATAAIDLEAYVGVPVRYDVLFASDPFLADGFRVSDGPGLAFGLSLAGRFFQDLAASLAYRQALTFRASDIEVFNAPATTPLQDAVNRATQQASAGKMALDESRLGASLGYTLRAIDLDLYASGTFDLVYGRTELLRVGAGYNYDRRIHVGAELLDVRPRFAADSIFNVFNIFPYNRARVELSVEIIPGLVVQGGYFLLLVQGAQKAGEDFRGQDSAHGPSGAVTFRMEHLQAGAVFEGATNSGGDYAFGGNYRRIELYGDLALLEEMLGFTLRLGTITVQNDWYEQIDQNEVATPETSYTLDLGVRARPLPWLTVRGAFVKNFESVLEGSYRVLTMLELRY